MSDKYDAFRQGVVPGGMMTTSRVRLLILYLLNSLKMPVTQKVLTDAICENGLANYFEVADAVAYLTESGSILRQEDDGTEKYTVSETGASIAQTLEMDLPRSVREKSLKTALYCATMEKHRSENDIEVEKTDSGYSVTFHVGKKNDRILSLTLYATDSDQVEALKKGFLNSPEDLCRSIFHALLID